MINFTKDWFRGVAYGGVVGAAIGAAVISGCSSPPVQMQVVAVDEPKINPGADFAAIQFYDCGEMSAIFFIKYSGGAEGTRITGPAHLDDMKLRASKLPYNNVHYFENNRPCGFTVQEKDVL